MTNAEKIIIAAAIDAAVADAIKDAIEEVIHEKEDLLNSLIGKKYIPRDNSYIREIVKGKKMNYHCSLIGVPCQIISRPYITEVQTFAKDKRERMIKVKSLKTGLIYEVCFAESWICD